MCPHTPMCPSPTAPDREAAKVVSGHPEQGWSLLCNGLIVFDDTGNLLPDCSIVAPHRAKPEGALGAADRESLPRQQDRRGKNDAHVA